MGLLFMFVSLLVIIRLSVEKLNILEEIKVGKVSRMYQAYWIS